MIIKLFQIFALSLASTVLVGVVSYRVLPSWQLLTSDVGIEGAWTVSILMHLYYGTCIGVGNIGASLTQKFNKVSPKLVIASSCVTVVLLNTVLAISQLVFTNMLLFFLLLSVCAFAVCLITLKVAKVHNKSLNQTGANNAPPG